MDISFYKEYLKSKGFSDTTIMSYIMSTTEFLKKDPDIDKPEVYMDFLIETAIKRKSYGKFYALMYFAEYKFNDNKPIRDAIINLIKERKRAPSKPTRYQGLKPLTQEEVVKVINGLEKEKHQIMSLIMVQTGLRIGDVLRIPDNGMRIDKFMEGEGLKIECIAKGKKPRVVWIWDMAIAKTLLDYASKVDFGTGLIFVEEIHSNNPNNDMKDYLRERLNYTRYWKDLKQSLNTNKIDKKRFAPHSFRRNFARATWEKYRSVETLRLMMGHARYETSLGYLRDDGLDVAELYYKLQMNQDMPNSS